MLTAAETNRHPRERITGKDVLDIHEKSSRTLKKGTGSRKKRGKKGNTARGGGPGRSKT